LNQKLSDWASIAEIIGAIAIVLSLLFVGVELRYTNTLAATESLREGTQIWVDEYKRNFGTEESTAFMRKALNNYEDLDDDEKGRFFASMLGLLAAYDTIYNQYEGGLLREDVFISIATGYFALVEIPGAQYALRDATALPRYLLDYSVNEALIGREEDLAAAYSFLRSGQ
jgi:hypothetical protein